MEISLNQKSFLVEKISKLMEYDPITLWKSLEGMEDKTYRFLLALSYNEPENFKYEISKLLEGN